MDFTWDDKKAEGNARKHGIDFSTAALAFFDPGRIEEYDAAHSGGEDRWLLLGLVRTTVVFVVYTERDAVVRIISARKANKNEREDYYKAQTRS